MTTPTLAEQATIRALQGTIMNMDSISQMGLNKITTIARMALLSLETPIGNMNTDYIAYAFEAIAHIAWDASESVNSLAEEVGCHDRDEAWQRRADAYRAAQKGSIP